MMLVMQKLKAAHENDNSILHLLSSFRPRAKLRNYLQLVFNLSTQYLKAAFL